MRYILLLTALLASLAQATEYENRPPEGLERGGPDDDIMSIFGKKVIPVPKEQAFEYPNIKDLNEWAAIKFYQELKTNDYYLSLDSISVGTDEIVRYVITISPKAGGNKNTLFEGIDCKTDQFVTYGWGNQDNEWTKNSRPIWKVYTKNQYNSWQGSLADEFCKMGDPWPVETIRKSFKTHKLAGDCWGCKAK